MQSRMPGLLNGFLVSGVPGSFMLIKRNLTGSVPRAETAFSIVTPMANVPLGWLTQRYGPCLYELVKTSTASSFRFGILYRSCMLNHEPLAPELRAAPTLQMTLN